MTVTDLYLDPDGRSIVTQSMLKTFRRCPRQALYKYVDKLSPKHVSKPLRRGTWIHALLEEDNKGGDWKRVHRMYSSKFAELFEEEQEKLGDLPNEIYNLMTSYFWHYKNDEDWKVIEVEYTFETELPDGTVYRCRVDELVETPYGLYLVDHKSHARLPNLQFRLLDPQFPLYVWCARRNGIPVKGFIWNYIRTTAPRPLKFKLDGGLYARQGETDYPTALRSIKEADKNPRDFRDLLNSLKKQRYEHGAMQLSPFFRREWLEKDDATIRRAVREMVHTTKRTHRYPFHRRDWVERNMDRSCEYMCGYTDLCTTELLGGNTDILIRSGFNRDSDALDYYSDPTEEGKNE